MAEIVDNSPEMALDDPRMAEFLSAVKAPKPEPKAEKADVKPEVPASSAETKPEGKDDADLDESPDHLKARIRGLQAELTRRKGNSDRVEALEAELQDLREKVNKPAAQTSEFDWIMKLDDEALASKQTDWDDELADARAKYGRAEEAGDERAMERQGQRIITAKKTLSAFRKETLDRTKRMQAEADAAKSEAQSIHSEISAMHEVVSENFPEMLDQSSELWQAGNKIFNSHPALMARLGPLGQVVAAALAVVQHPELSVKRGSVGARREVLGTLEKSVKKALSTGASAPTTTRSVDYMGAVDSGDNLAKFNAMIDRIKGG